MVKKTILFPMRHFASKLGRRVNAYLNSYVGILDTYSRTSPFTIVYGIARTSLAISLLSTLLFNDIQTLYPEHLYKSASFTSFLANINLFWLYGYDSLWIPKLISIIILLIVISGYLPRITGVLHWWVSFSFFNSAVLVDGGDQILNVLTFLLIPITLLDNRINHWGKVKLNYPVSNLIGWGFFFLIEVQGAVLYLQAGAEKPYKLSEWRDGTAIYYWLNNNLFGAPDFLLTILNPILTNGFLGFVLTWAVVIFEVSLFAAFYMAPKKRVKLFYMAVVFHFSIWVFHGLGSFFFAAVGLLVIYMLNRYYAFKFQEVLAK